MSSDTKKAERDFLTHVEAYVSRRDGVDKLLKISRYTAKLIVSSNALPKSWPLNTRLKSFESSVGLSRKAFRLGKFIQDVNALRNCDFTSREETLLSVIAYGGEGVYYFVEQFVWLSKTGMIDKRHAKLLGKISAWTEFVGYFGSIWLKARELVKLQKEELRLVGIIESKQDSDAIFVSITESKQDSDADKEKLLKLKEKKLMKRLSIVQDLADGLMALGDIRDGNGLLSSPALLSFAGLCSAIISSRKNWLSC